MRGNCLCGAVEFEIVGEATRLYQCHCSLCRKQSGSTSNSSLLIEPESFRWLGGEDRISSYVKGRVSGPTSALIAGLPSPIPSAAQGTSGSQAELDGGIPLEVGAHVCVGSKATWDAIPAAEGTQFEHLPPDLETLLECLRRR